MDLKDLFERDASLYKQYVWWPLWRFFNIRDLYLNIKWFFQRLFRGYSDLDLWSLDQHLATIILKRIKAFRKQELHGYPAQFHHDFENSVPKEYHDLAPEVYWEEIVLGKIENAFVQILKEFDTNPDDNYPIEDMQKRDKEIKEGLQLFAEHFQSLWD